MLPLYKYPETFSNLYICPVSLNLIMYKFFVYGNNVYFHNKSRHSDLALQKYWINQCDWLRLCMAVAMVMTIEKIWKIFFYRVNIYLYEKNIGIRQFLNLS